MHVRIAAAARRPPPLAAQGMGHPYIQDLGLYRPFRASLATLPRAPDSVPLADLVYDFDVPGQRQVREVLLGLMNRGYAIEVLNVSGHRAAWITSAGWENARTAARAYFDAVYGDEL